MAVHNSGGDDLTAALTEGCLTRGELQRSAANICRFLLQTPAFRRSIGRTSALDDQMEAMAEQDMQQAAQNGLPLTLRDGTAIDIAAIDNGYRRTTPCTCAAVPCRATARWPRFRYRCSQAVRS